MTARRRLAAVPPPTPRNADVIEAPADAAAGEPHTRQAHQTGQPTAPAPATAYPDPIPHLMPFGSISTLSGASGVGKTAFMASQIVAPLLKGDPVFGEPTNKPVAIGMLACDRPWRDHSAWFEKAGISDLPHCSLRDEDYAWDILRDWRKIPEIFGKLVDSIGLPPGSLLLVDPLPLFIPGRLIDYKDVAIGLGQLDNQIRRRGLTMLGIFHTSKQKSNKQDRYMRPQDRILGSSALIGYSETAFYLLSPDEAERKAYEFGAIPHQCPPIVLEYRRDANGLFVPAHDLDTINAEEMALNCFPPVGEPVSASVIYEQIRKKLDCSESTAKRFVRGLVGDGRVRIVGRGIYERANPA